MINSIKYPEIPIAGNIPAVDGRIIPESYAEILRDHWQDMAEHNQDYEDYAQESGLYEGVNRYDAEDITSMKQADLLS